jgi:hypothetical protein
MSACETFLREMMIREWMWRTLLRDLDAWELWALLHQDHSSGASLELVLHDQFVAGEIEWRDVHLLITDPVPQHQRGENSVGRIPARSLLLARSLP